MQGENPYEDNLYAEKPVEEDDPLEKIFKGMKWGGMAHEITSNKVWQLYLLTTWLLT